MSVDALDALKRRSRWSQAGGNLIMHSSDLAIFRQTLKSELNTLRGKLGANP